MTAHLKDGLKRDKMITYLTTKGFYDKMKTVVDDDRHTDIRCLSDLIRLSVEKEVRRRTEWFRTYTWYDSDDLWQGIIYYLIF